MQRDTYRKPLFWTLVAGTLTAIVTTCYTAKGSDNSSPGFANISNEDLRVMPSPHSDSEAAPAARTAIAIRPSTASDAGLAQPTTAADSQNWNSGVRRAIVSESPLAARLSRRLTPDSAAGSDTARAPQPNTAVAQEVQPAPHTAASENGPRLAPSANRIESARSSEVAAAAPSGNRSPQSAPRKRTASASFFGIPFFSTNAPPLRPNTLQPSAAHAAANRMPSASRTAPSRSPAATRPGPTAQREVAASERTAPPAARPSNSMKPNATKAISPTSLLTKLFSLGGSSDGPRDGDAQLAANARRPAAGQVPLAMGRSKLPNEESADAIAAYRDSPADELPASNAASASATASLASTPYAGNISASHEGAALAPSARSQPIEGESATSDIVAAHAAPYDAAAAEPSSLVSPLTTNVIIPRDAIHVEPTNAAEGYAAANPVNPMRARPSAAASPPAGEFGVDRSVAGYELGRIVAPNSLEPETFAPHSRLSRAYVAQSEPSAIVRPTTTLATAPPSEASPTTARALAQSDLRAPQESVAARPAASVAVIAKPVVDQAEDLNPIRRPAAPWTSVAADLADGSHLVADTLESVSKPAQALKETETPTTPAQTQVARAETPAAPDQPHVAPTEAPVTSARPSAVRAESTATWAPVAAATLPPSPDVTPIGQEDGPADEVLALQQPEALSLAAMPLESWRASREEPADATAASAKAPVLASRPPHKTAPTKPRAAVAPRKPAEPKQEPVEVQSTFDFSPDRAPLRLLEAAPRNARQVDPHEDLLEPQIVPPALAPTTAAAPISPAAPDRAVAPAVGVVVATPASVQPDASRPSAPAAVQAAAYERPVLSVTAAGSAVDLRIRVQ